MKNGSMNARKRTGDGFGKNWNGIISGMGTIAGGAWRMITDRTIKAMHKQYGKDPLHKCGDCCNYLRWRYHARILHKCRAYGLTHSEASDWRVKWEACGLYNKPFDEDAMRPLMFVLTRTREKEPTEPDPRQLTFLPDEQEAAE
jgi:hypothetical protein